VSAKYHGKRTELRETLPQALERPQVGHGAHVLISALLNQGLRTYDRSAVIEVARRSRTLSGLSIKERMMRQQYLLSSAALYYRLFAPPLDWSFEGSEVDLAGVVVDHLWAAPGGWRVIDELKTGRRSGPLYPDVARDQLARQLEAGRRCFGRRFRAVRLLVFSEPNRSLVLYPSGQSEPLFDAARDRPDQAGGA
jgi:hypothetical protein